MNIFDIITLIFIVLAIFNGLRKGFISQLCSFVGIIGGVALAIAFGGEVGQMLGLDEAYSKAVGFIVTFIVCAIAMLLIAKLLGGLFSAIGLQGLDKLLGIALALLKYGIALSVLFVAFENLNKEVKIVDNRHFTESKSFKPVSGISDTALDWFNTFKKEVGQ